MNNQTKMRRQNKRNHAHSIDCNDYSINHFGYN